MGDGLLSLCWNNHRSTFAHIVSSLREKERYSDATLACEGKFYPVHKLVLSVCSEYFDAMLSSTPCKHPVIVLKDIKTQDLESLLIYMYDGVVSVAQDDLARLVKAAELLQIKGLAFPDDTPPQADAKKDLTDPSILTVAPREVKTSPQIKRRKRNDNIDQIEVTTGLYFSSPTSSPPTTICAQAQDLEQSKLRQRLEGHRTEQTQVNTIQVVVDESLVKEEGADSDKLNKRAVSYGVVVTGDGIVAADGTTDPQVSSQRFETHAIPVTSHQSQPLAEAVAEALAGPSSMQTWLTTGEITPGFASVETYTTEATTADNQSTITEAPQLSVTSGGSAEVITHTTAANLQDNTQIALSETGIKLEHKVGTKPTTVLRKCPNCTYVTSRLHCFVAHMRIHTGEKPFRCSFCPYRTARRWSLSVHMKTHTGEKPYHCKHCTYRTSRRDVLNAHLRTHYTPDKLAAAAAQLQELNEKRN